MRDIVPHRVIKSDSNIFIVEYKGEFISCTARKKIKSKSDILAGDFVELVFLDNNPIIENVIERTNSLIRPAVANIDQIIAVVACEPEIDYYLIDKLIINAFRQGIDIVLCLNKSDLSTEMLLELKSQYGNVVKDIIITSASSGEIEDLERKLKSKLSCIAGQSAVGKSSLVNALLNLHRQKVGDLSEKLKRGKNTTTRAEIIAIDKDTYIVDTPGFSMLDIHDVDFKELDLYYDEYVQIASQCKYHRCRHVSEPNCAVKAGVESGKLNRKRYERYVVMQDELKNVKK